MSTTRWLSIPCLVAIAACAAAPSAGTDAGTSTDAGPPCAQLGGLFAFDPSSTCSPDLYVPVFACVVQRECELQLVTNGSALVGSITGNEFTLTDPMSDQVCTGTLAENGSATIHCTVANNTLSCDLLARPGQVPTGFENTCCIPGKSDCAEGTQCRPTLIDADGYLYYPALCHAPAGTKAEGETCTRSDARGASNDDCGPGLACTLYGANASGMVCAKVCSGRPSCDADEVCRPVAGAIPAGLCADACDIFADTCGAGRRCAISDGFFTTTINTESMETCVQSKGSLQAGQSCNEAAECAVGMECITGANDPVPVCHPYCDLSHPCAVGACTGGSLPTEKHNFLGFCDQAN